MLYNTIVLSANTESVRIFVIDYVWHWVRLLLCLIVFSEANLVEDFALLVLVSTLLFFLIRVL